MSRARAIVAIELTALWSVLVSLLTSPSPGALSSRVVPELPVDVSDALRRAAAWGTPPGETIRDTWEALATLAAHDLAVARAIEPHWDAASILEQAGRPLGDGVWGVFAAEGGDDPLIATPVGDGWALTGTKPWCSLADRLDAALVTAATVDGSRRLFAVGLRHDGVQPDHGTWVARGLTEIPSGAVRFEAVPAEAVGEPGWYLSRPGFAWGGIGVAACWFGGAVGIARTLHAAAVVKPHPFLLMHLGAVDQVIHDSRRALAEAAQLIDSGADVTPQVLALRVRATVARACDEVIWRAGHALGPAPLALDAAHAKRVADLQLYVRQHHAERDLASLGEGIAAGVAPW